MNHNDITLEKRIAFLKTLELPEIPESLMRVKKTPVSLQDTSNSSCVDAGQIACFSSEVTAGEKADILNSCLIAQLAASKKFNRETETADWYQDYSTTLYYCGWTMESFQFQKYKSSSSSYGIDTFMLNLLNGMVTGNMLTYVTAAINFMKSLASSDPRSILFDNNSHSGSHGNFQLGACFHNSNVLTMNLGCSYFSASQETENFFLFHFNQTDSNIYFANQDIMLDTDVYAQVRDTVIKKLGDRAQTYIQDLDI